MRLLQHRIEKQGCTSHVVANCKWFVYSQLIMCVYYIANYEVTRPAAARVINEDNYNTGVVQYVNNGSVVFGEGESYSTIWPGTNLQWYSIQV